MPSPCESVREYLSKTLLLSATSHGFSSLNQAGRRWRNCVSCDTLSARGIFRRVACYGNRHFMSDAEPTKVDFRQAALEHLDALYGFAMVLTHDPTEAQDLVQETY